MKYEPIPGTFVIGLGHKARQGKDSTARALAKLTGGEAERFSFADALRAVARVEYGMTVKDAPLLQRLGTDVYRKKDPDVWVRAMYWRLHEERPQIAIITDIRFPNEGDFVKALGGTTVRIERRDDAGRLFVDPSRDPNHLSETAMNDYPWDFTIATPDGDLAGLNRIVRAWYESFIRSVA